MPHKMEATSRQTQKKAFCFAIDAFDPLRVFFHKHMVKFHDIANDIQSVVFDTRVLQMCNNVLMFQQSAIIIRKCHILGGFICICNIGQNLCWLMAFVTFFCVYIHAKRQSNIVNFKTNLIFARNIAYFNQCSFYFFRSQWKILKRGIKIHGGPVIQTYNSGNQYTTFQNKLILIF